ncbi:MAG: DUF1349 domain-containing protein [Solobacterium sp.]|nr:DUF1349 domain-containing protein [Solobacterium sp.]
MNQPKLFILNKDSLVVETEPFTDLRPMGNGAEAVEMRMLPKGNFSFSLRIQYDFKNTFDQCGITLYEGKKRKAIIGIEYYDEEITKISTIVYHGGVGDKSIRDISSGIKYLYYRVWYRGGLCRIQYSFNGDRYLDLREFALRGEGEIHPGIYACSPANSSFDCIFSKVKLEDET